MPRPRSVPADEVLRRATALFWRRGYEATSMRDLVEVTGANRAALYGDFADKRELFLHALDHFTERVVSANVAALEAEDATLADIHGYFHALIDAQVAHGLPADGCLMANTMTEAATRDPAVRDRVRCHVDRLRAGFTRALANAERAGDLTEGVDAAAFGHFLAIATQGLWAYSRICEDEADLRSAVTTMLAPLFPADPALEDAP